MRMRSLLFACVLVACASTAHAAKGEWSVGGLFGAGFYSGGSLNDSLAAAGFKKVSRGWEYGGSIRYGISPKLSLDYEVLSLNGKGTTKSVTPKFQAEVNGIAAPLNLYYAMSPRMSLFVGAGPVFKSSWSVKQDTVEVASQTKTAFCGQAGLEGRFRLGHKVSFTARALGRIAKAKDLAAETDPSTKFDASMTGFAVGVGLRYGAAGN